MPDIPIDSVFGYLGVAGILLGVFLLLTGYQVIRIKTVTVAPGKRTRRLGAVFMLVGLVFLVPDFVELVSPTFDPLSTGTPVAAQPTDTLVPTLAPTSTAPVASSTPVPTELPTATLAPLPSLAFTSSPTAGPQPQYVRWGLDPDIGRKPGICVDGEICSQFVPCEDLESEIEQRLLPQLSWVPDGSRVVCGNLGVHVDYVVGILDPEGNEIGRVWFGRDPEENWDTDGKVRAGLPGPPARVRNTFERYSDGSYHPDE